MSTKITERRPGVFPQKSRNPVESFGFNDYTPPVNSLRETFTERYIVSRVVDASSDWQYDFYLFSVTLSDSRAGVFSAQNMAEYYLQRQELRK
ncbi:hypothetical protein [Entomohabitans teleogrylli]|uniref:hypothetical protein n=1 Tax=Entomohabitans teleogrylli TaxID=1384589 RepID=UPI0012B69EB0|nr:hypothetical protein [Entomohabitans teleogrylli]